MLNEIRDWIAFLFEGIIMVYVVKEYYYDFAKDSIKKQRRTKTTKKATTMPDGTTVTEENIESVENKGE